MHVLVLSPHRDDAAFSCGLFLWRCVSQGKVLVTVVNIYTHSAYAPYLLEQDAGAVSSARRAEDEAFIEYLGTPRPGAPQPKLLDLGMLDGPLRRRIAPEQTLEVICASELAAEALAVAASLPFPAADLVITPLSLGGHLDHRIVRTAASLAFPLSRLVFYEDLPYACRLSAAQRETQTEAALREVGSALHPVLLSDASARERKRAMCSFYPSQIAPEVADEMAAYAGVLGGERLCPSAGALQPLLDFIDGHSVEIAGRT